MRVGGNVPGVAAAAQAFGVNTDTVEVVNQSLYDSASYAAAGMNTMNFFLTPIGQGTGFGGSTKNKSDTNMVLAGQLPQNQAFLLTSISLEFQPTTPTVTADMPSALGADAVQNLINDVYKVRRTGNLIFTVGSKDYLTEAPLMNIGPNTRFRIDAALDSATTAAASLQTRTGFADVQGGPRDLNPSPIFLIPNQNFQLTLNWPEGLQAITNPMRIFARLNGMLYRKAQ